MVNGVFVASEKTVPFFSFQQQWKKPHQLFLPFCDAPPPMLHDTQGAQPSKCKVAACRSLTFSKVVFKNLWMWTRMVPVSSSVSGHTSMQTFSSSVPVCFLQ